MIDRAGRGSLFPLINVLSRVLSVIQERICYNHSSFASSNPFFNKIIEGRLNLDYSRDLNLQQSNNLF